jgi:hypothetical protein
MIYAVIDPEKVLKFPNMKMEVFQYFGIEDSILNHIYLNKKIEDHGADDTNYQKGESLLNKRKFEVSCLKQGEVLALSADSMDMMKRDFQNVSRKFYKEMIQ